MANKGYNRKYNFLVRAVVWVLALCFYISAFALESSIEGESFTIRMKDYFVELQGGQRVDLEINYQYAPNIVRADIPDYRAVQILVEDALYGMQGTGPYWEITNKEIVFRLLKAFPQFSKVKSQFNIQPRALLNISRGSTVEYGQHDLKDYQLLTQIDQDAYYQAREGHYNILVPRPLKASVTELMQRVKNSAENAQDPAGIIFDIPCFPLAGSSYTFRALLDGLKPKGPYSAVVLPEAMGEKNGLTKISSLGNLKGIVRVANETSTLGNPVVETSLADSLGLTTNFSRLALPEAREQFFEKTSPYLIVEEKYAKPYQLLKYRIEPYAPETPLALFANFATKSEVVPKLLLKLLTP